MHVVAQASDADVKLARQQADPHRNGSRAAKRAAASMAASEHVHSMHFGEYELRLGLVKAKVELRLA
jgi:hypothetical protein